MKDDLISRQEKTQLSQEDATFDCISRQAAIEVADAVWSVTGDKNVAKVWDQIRGLPSAQPERKTGRWIPVTNGRGGHECDQCHEYAPSYKSGDEYLSDYCPNCGCKMEVDG